METNERGKIVGAVTGLTAGLSPMHSITFIAAVGIAGLAAWIWMHGAGDPPPAFPLYGSIAASYAGGFLIGRVFRRIVKIAAIIAAIAIGALALLSRAHVETSKAKQAVETGSTWFQARASRVKDSLLHVLPSGFAGGAGVFAGARRRRIVG